MQLDWSQLANVPDPGAAFRAGMEKAQQARQEAAKREALRAYGMGAPNALNALMQADPVLGIQLQQQQATTQRQQRLDQATMTERRQKNIIAGAQIIRQTQPKDQATWTQALSTADQMGIDTAGVPREWNEQTAQYAQGLINAADAFEPQKPESSPYGFMATQPGGGVYRTDRRTGDVNEIIRPNDGSAPTGAPVAAPSGVRVTDQASYDAVPPGATYQTPSGETRVKPGGQTQPASGNFLQGGWPYD